MTGRSRTRRFSGKFVEYDNCRGGRSTMRIRPSASLSDLSKGAALKQTVNQQAFQYRGGNALPGTCRLRVWEAPERPAVVIASDVPDNPGPCVTNSVEVIAELVWQLLERPTT